MGRSWCYVFFLVVFYQRSARSVSGLLTVYTNRVGDVLFLLCFIFMWAGSYYTSDGLAFFSSLVWIFLILGCFTKSAQTPFSAWLPAAIAAPTPVSSLVHSSTLVTAGVYVLIRYNVLSFLGFWVFVVSVITVVLAGFGAIYEIDFKKVVAMSTLSQLGVMIVSLCLNQWLLTFLHVLVHALFKASLFLRVGVRLALYGGRQEARVNRFFWDGFVQMIYAGTLLCLRGVPFIVGFYSKDFILGNISRVGLLFFVLFFRLLVNYLVLFSFIVVACFWCDDQFSFWE